MVSDDSIKCDDCGNYYMSDVCDMCNPKERKIIPKIRQFETGATRDSDEGKFDYEGFYSPLVMERYAQYMNKHRVQSDGGLRDSDNWQKGIPKNDYMKSAYRHFFDWWKQHRGYKGQDTLEESICALIFNAQGYLFEILKNKEKGGNKCNGKCKSNN